MVPRMGPDGFATDPKPHCENNLTGNVFDLGGASC